MEIKDLAAIKLVLEDTVRVLGVKINNFELSEVYINSDELEHLKKTLVDIRSAELDLQRKVDKLETFRGDNNDEMSSLKTGYERLLKEHEHMISALKETSASEISFLKKMLKHAVALCNLFLKEGLNKEASPRNIFKLKMALKHVVEMCNIFSQAVLNQEASPRKIFQLKIALMYAVEVCNAFFQAVLKQEAFSRKISKLKMALNDAMEECDLLLQEVLNQEFEDTKKQSETRGALSPTTNEERQNAIELTLRKLRMQQSLLESHHVLSSPSATRVRVPAAAGTSSMPKRPGGKEDAAMVDATETTRDDPFRAVSKNVRLVHRVDPIPRVNPQIKWRSPL